MSYKIIFTPLFLAQAKRLSKKYASFKSDLASLEPELSSNPELGIDLGNGLFKIRLAIKSKGKEKSGGARIITFLKNNKGEIYLLTVYDKSEVSNIEIRFLKQLIKDLFND